MTTPHKNLIIRADASTRIGTGHIMRCIALAQAWQDQGGNVTFLSHCDSKALRQRIIDEGLGFIPIEKPHPDVHDLDYTLETFKQFKAQNSELKTWVILDGYHFTSDYQEEIRKAGYGVLVLDDYNHLPHYHADILLNQNIHGPKLSYSSDENTVQLLGCKYVLLRREFLRYKGLRKKVPERARKILITLGGVPPGGIMEKVVRVVNRLSEPELDVQVLLGQACVEVEWLKKQFDSSIFRVRLLRFVKHMPSLMAWADFAISAGGSTCFELAFMQVPFAVIPITKNQEEETALLDKSKVAVDLKSFEWVDIAAVADILKNLLHNARKRRRLISRGREIIDGKGMERIYSHIGNM